ncbi:hypothetical protein Pint_33887 [Pistacia integerrima]|uniref:Uncharacterized protein n=1 Tax=Pistacia integerrima TaxID=434235 RepID=A0ACC0X5T8_9ROSI|nr:hypothetical protein Pint_33887 [Pistacia integerrima]
MELNNGSIAGGVPMVTWPLYGEEFFNEKLVTDVLKIGVRVGAQEWREESEKMRRKTWVLGMQARKAVEYGGSSSSNLKALLEDLRLSCPRDKSQNWISSSACYITFFSTNTY